MVQMSRQMSVSERWPVTLVPGDGIGPEVVQAARRRDVGELDRVVAEATGSVASGGSSGDFATQKVTRKVVAEGYGGVIESFYH